MLPDNHYPISRNPAFRCPADRHPAARPNGISPLGYVKSISNNRRLSPAKNTEGTKISFEKVVHFLNISHHSKQVKKCIPSRGFPTSALVLPTRAAALATLLDKGTLRPYRYETEMLIEHPKQ